MFWRRKQREQDLDRELRSHLESEAEEQSAEGVSPEEARYAARRAFGNTTLIKEATREMWGWTKLEQLWQDVRYALRALRQNPAFTVTAVLSLALGIGANTAIFTVVNAVLLRPLPFHEPDRLVQLWETQPVKGYSRNVVNPFNFLDWREHTHTFAGMAAMESGDVNLTGLGDPIALPALQVSSNFFSILSVPPALGRTFLPEDGSAGQKVVILSFGFWQSRFAGDRAVIGRHLTVDGERSTIVGVMPRGLTLPKYSPAIWTPLPIVRSKEWESGRYLAVIARLKSGVTLEQAQQDLGTVTQQSANERPATDKGWSAEAIPMLGDATEHVRLPLLVLLAAVGLVLLIACANVANLLLMRASRRLREIAIRAALGATRGRLLQQLLSESLLLALLAGIAGVASASLFLKGLLALIPPDSPLPRMDTIHLDGPVLLFAFALSLMSAVVFGLAPSLQVSHATPQEALQAGAILTAAKSMLRQALVIVEIALSLVLLVGAGLMLRSFERLTSVDTGFDTQRILTLRMFTSPAKYLDNRKRAIYFSQILAGLRSVPGVKAAGSVHFLPLQGRVSGSCFARSDEPPPIPSTSSVADFLVVSPGYFEAMGAPLVNGRFLDDHDRFDAKNVVLVNQEFVKRYLSRHPPIGQKLNICWTARNPVEIVGVVANARQTELQVAPRPTIFVNNLQSPMFFAQLVVRTAGDPVRMARALEKAVHRVDQDQPLTHVQTMEQVFSDSVAQPRLQLVLLLVFGGIAGSLALIGIHGVVGYSVTQRTREIGIRMALGAQSADVRRMVLREGVLLALTGVTLGVGGALAFTRVLRTLLFETVPTDPTTLLAVSGGILLSVLLATLLPANRAAQVDPITTLRYE